LPELDTGFKNAVEERHRSWLQDSAYNFENNDICTVWSDLAEIQTPPMGTTDFLYLRFIGDRSIREKDFRRLQKIEYPRCRSGLKVSRPFRSYQICNSSSK